MEKRYLSVRELSEYLGVPRHTIYCWTSMRKIPFVKMGKSVRFDIKAIEKWIKENSVEVSEIHRVSRY